MKKVLSIIMACVMTLMMLSTAFAANSSEADELVLFDFSDHSSNYGNLVNTTERANEGKTGSAKLSIATAKNSGTIGVGENKDWTAYKYLKITMASKYAYPGKMNVLVHFNNNNAYAQTELNIGSKPFKNIYVPISGIKASGGDIDWADVKDIQLYFEGWNIDSASIDSAAEYYFDEIALCKNTTDYTDITSTSEYVVSEIGNTLLRQCSRDMYTTLFGLETAKWDMAGSNSQVAVGFDSVDVSAYDNLYITLYNPTGQSDKIGVHVYDTSGAKTYALTVDWTGWKTVAIPITAYSGLNTQAVKEVDLWDYGWSYTSNNDYMNIGRIWFAKDNSAASEAVLQGSTEKDAGWVQHSGLDLSKAKNISFDLYGSKNATTETEKYATAVVLNDGSNHTKGIEMNFEGWKTFTYEISEFNLSSLTNVTLYISTQWGIGGYSEANECDGLSVKVKNIKIENEKETYELLYTTADKKADSCYWVFGKAVTTLGNAELSVVEAETQTPVNAELVAVSNKLYAKFDKTAGKAYTVTLSGLTAEALTNTFTYSEAAEEALTATEFSLENGSLSVDDKAAKVSYEYQNGSDKAETASVVIAVYDSETGALEEIQTVNYTNLLSGRRGELTAYKEGDYTGKKVKGFVFSSMNDLSPLKAAASN